MQLKLIGNSASETKTIDSLSYLSNHKNAKSIAEELELIAEKLSKIGFLTNRILTQNKVSDSTYAVKLNLGNRIKWLHIYIGTNSNLNRLLFPNENKDSLVLPYGQTEAFLNQSLKKMDEKGYAFTKLNLTKLKIKGNVLFTTLKLEAEKQRKLNSIVVKYGSAQENNDFPKGHLAQIHRKYKNKIFNQDLVSQIHDDFEKYSFINQLKYPEVLFTKDSTKVYVYIENVKTNNFDGFIGFNNNDNNKITLNGYLDLTLQNIIKAGEQFSLYWKSDGNNQKTFRTSLELPYILQSPLGLRGQLNIFKQDSTFQNTKTAIALSYYLDYNTRLYLGYQSTVSSDIQNSNNSLITDYKSSYLTSELAYSKIDNRNSMFLHRSQLNIKTGIGTRETNNLLDNSAINKQLYIDLLAMHTFYLNEKNSINITSQNYFLQSTNYITNELFRFGGVNSIRGFTENSLQANLMTALLTEYRYIASPTLYFHTIIDYSVLQDSSLQTETDVNTNLLGLGLGLGIKTKTGILKISIAAGSPNNQKIEFSNTILHLNYNLKF
jgi:hypothetical protein